tara:strand:- start:805 stop:912 length:108 start_codon:yes stop_codon:yes gene_type:complete
MLAGNTCRVGAREEGSGGAADKFARMSQQIRKLIL